MSESTTPPDTIVFVHGLWVTPHSWAGWRKHFEGLGYTTIAPGWPGVDEKTPAELRADGSSLAKTDAAAVLARYEEVIAGLDKPPIIIGHSFGGAFTQVLISKGLGAAGVAVDSATVKGIPDLPISTIRSAFGVLGNPLNARGVAVPFSPKQFKYAFGNTLTEEASQAAWEEFAIPAASKVLFNGAAAQLPGTVFDVDFKKADRAPLLFLGGGRDHVVPAKVSKKNAAKYQPAADYKEYLDKSHFIVGEPGWESVVTDVSDWIAAKVGSPVAA